MNEAQGSTGASSNGAGQASQDASAFEAATFRKIARRLVPLLFLGYFVAFLDRVNIGFAKLQMAGDLSLSDEVYGFGAGVFFIGYFLFEVPSNLLLARVGARRWIARIMISWGVLSSCFLFTGSVHWGPVAAAFGCTDAQFTFYILRFLLGVAEAGFYPGIVLYLTFWFPAARRAQVNALFMTAIAISNVFGSLISGAILQYMDGAAALRGWQWLFLLEGIPSVLVGFLLLAVLPDGPAKAKWLSPKERTLIAERLHADEQGKSAHGQRHRVGEMFLDPRIWICALSFLPINAGFYAINFWMPTIIQEVGIDKDDYLSVGLLAMIPYGVAAVSMVLWARHSDRTGERRWHSIIPLFAASIGFVVLATVGHQPVLSMIGITLVAAGALTWLAMFWMLPTAFLSGMAAAGGIAMINSLGNLGGYFGPDLIGRIRDANGGDSSAAFIALAVAALVSAALTFAIATIRPKPSAVH